MTDEQTEPKVESTIGLLQEEYRELMHAMQTGVEYLKEKEPKLVDTKHLRVGVNSALVSLGATVKLLIDKGLLTEHEYWKALVDAMKEEVQSHEAALSKATGAAVTLR